MTHSGGRDSRGCRRIVWTSREVTMAGASRVRLGSVGKARGEGTGRGPERNYNGRPQSTDCVRMVCAQQIWRSSSGSLLSAAQRSLQMMPVIVSPSRA
jgi:hypothetical protein